MKLANINDNVPAVIIGESAVEVASAFPVLTAMAGPLRMPWLIAHFDELAPKLHGLDADQGVHLSEVRLRAPLPMPGKIAAAVGNYREGLEFSQPLDFFMKASSSVIGPGDIVQLPDRDLKSVDHEAELLAVIGRRVSGPITRETAKAAIFGFTGFIDVSGRGFGEVGFVRKSCDTFGPMGPWIVTADEVGDAQALEVTLEVAGELRQSYNTSDMDHDIPSLVCWLSEIMTLEPGDVISTGTNHQGIGRLQHGDRVDLTIERIGQLTVSVEDRRRRSWPRGIDANIASLARRWREGERSRS